MLDWPPRPDGDSAAFAVTNPSSDALGVIMAGSETLVALGEHAEEPQGGREHEGRVPEGTRPRDIQT
jgi:hypothetical protein